MQKLKRTAAEQSAENKHLKKENKELNAENKKLKGLLLTCHGQLPEEAPQRQGQDTYLARSNSELLDHPTISFQKTEENLATENNFLKVENERLNAEIRQLKEDVRWLQPSLLQLQSEAEQNCYISKSVSHLLNDIHKGVFVQDHHAMDLRAFNRTSSLELNHDLANLQKIGHFAEIKYNSHSAGTCYDNTAMTEFLAKIDADDESRVILSDFTGIDGRREQVGKYSFPLSLVSTVKRIIDIHGDISVTSKISTNSAETIYILFCASLKEMDDTQLEQLAEDRILKWRDAIKDALLVNFKVDFAMERLKKIAHGYIGRIESQELRNMTGRISKLEADLNTGKKELAERKELSKKYRDVAEEFNGKSLSLFTWPAHGRCMLMLFLGMLTSWYL